MDTNSVSLIEMQMDRIMTVSPPPSNEKMHFPLSLKRVSEDEWDEMVSRFDGVCQEMTAVFARDRWPGVTLEPTIMLDRDEPVAGALVMIQRLPLGLANLAVIKWGPAIRDETSGSCAAIYAQAIDMLMAEYAHKRGMMLSILPRAPRRINAECVDFLNFRGFKPGSGLKFPNRYIVNLRLDEEAQRKSLSQKWRYHLGKSEKQGLAFEHAGLDRLDEFDRLYRVMAERKRFPDHSAYETVPHLMTAKVEALRPQLFFVMRGEDIVAGALVFTAGRTAAYLYGATSDAALPLRAGYFLQWNIVRWLRDNTGADLYDLGGTDGFQGLHQFKKGLVGDEGMITSVPPIYNYATNSIARVWGTAAYAARDGLNEVRHLINWLRKDRAKPNQER